MNEGSQKRHVIETFQRVLEQSAFVLKENPELMFQQLYDRLQFQDNKYIVSAGGDKTLILWNVYTYEKLFILKGYTYRITTFAFDPYGKYIVLGDEAGQMLLLSIENTYKQYYFKI